VWLSRRESLERHVVGEEAVIVALRAAFGSSSVVVFGRDESGAPEASSQYYDVARGREVFGEATVLIGPHGAAFANVMFTPGAAMVLLPVCDGIGCPAAQDMYMSYLAAAVGVELVVASAPVGESVYRNYTVGGREQVDELVRIVQRIEARRGG